MGLVCLAYLAGCGDSITTASTTVYGVPAPLAKPYPAQLGGAVQTPLVTTPSAITATIGGAAGFSNISSAGGATFNRPISITTDGQNLYVADFLNNVIRQINISTQHVTTIAGNVAGLPGSVDGTGTAAYFNRPSAITTDGTYLYVTDSANFTIRRINISTGLVQVVAGAPGTAGSVDAVGGNARFNVLNGITTDGKNLYVSDSNNTIRRIVIDDWTVTTLAGASGTTGSADGAQAVARFNQPAGLTTDGANLYVADYANSTIRRIDLASGTVVTIAGKVGPGGAAGSHADSTDGTGLSARFNQPAGITCDGLNLYVTDSYDNTVRKIAGPAGAVSGAVTTIFTNGAAADNTTFGITTDGVRLYLTDFSRDNLRHTIKYIE